MSRHQDKEKFEEKLCKVGEKILELLKRYQALSDLYQGNPSQLNVNKYGICLEVIQEEAKVCDLNLQILETEVNKENGKHVNGRIRELENDVYLLWDKLLRQKAIQKQMEESFRESKQRRLHRLKLLLGELRKYMNTLDIWNKYRMCKTLSLPKLV